MFSNQVEKLSQRLDKDGEMDVRLTRISDKVETQAQRLGTDLAELRIVTANGDKTLETNTNRSLASLQSQMQDIFKKADSYVLLFNETIKNLQTKSTNELSNLRQTISSDVSKLENRLIQMISEVRSSNQAGLADLRPKTDNRVSAIESRLSAIERRFDSHVTTNSQLMKTIRSDIDMLDKSGRCRKKGYTWHSEKCLKVHLLNKSYYDAKRFCEAEGAHLYIIKSRGDDEAPLRFALKQVGGLNNRYTVGANDNGREGKFFWDDGSSLPTSSELWNTNEPNSWGGNEDCVDAFVTDDGLLINDHPCDLWSYFICQYDP
ncbi:hypothetical protein C0Q70_07358 [Pomacea canaliculata]|uniref:C-type lectin domain-containing protein n=1 Tax=Pomacea canaliculata TaxID=400727 RepID=A0A2T7PEU0_POMCA|nr:hypothetical protein C0Q70_07358 [Pomacea canaliculata]